MGFSLKLKLPTGGFLANPLGATKAFVDNPLAGVYSNVTSVSPQVGGFLTDNLTPSNQTVAGMRAAAAVAAVVATGGTALGIGASSVGLGGVAASVGSTLAAIPGGAALGASAIAAGTKVAKENISRAMGTPQNTPSPATPPPTVAQNNPLDAAANQPAQPAQSAVDKLREFLTPGTSAFSTPLLIAGAIGIYLLAKK